MFIEVKYDGRTYGTGDSAEKYTLIISKMKWHKALTVSVRFNFESPTGGQSDNYDSEASVIGGEICLPKRQALALATAILWYCQLADNQSDSPPIELHLDEADFISKIAPKVTVQELAKILQVEEKYIIQELYKCFSFIPSSNTYLTLEEAQKVQEQLRKSP